MRRLVVAVLAAALLGVGVAGAYALGSSDAGDARERGSGPSAASRGDGGDDPATTTTPADPATTGPPACTSASGRCARIVDIRLDADHYVAEYEVDAFDPLIFQPGAQGTPDDHHVHFFFDTTPPQNAGTNGNPPGQWTVWDRVQGGGALRFDDATVADARGAGARQMCVLVADSSHAVETDTGNCVDLPT